MIESITSAKTAQWLARRVAQAQVLAGGAWVDAVRLTREVKEAHITIFVTIGSETLSQNNVTRLRLLDSGGDVCYTRELDLARRDGEGATCRIDISVRVEENDDV